MSYRKIPVNPKKTTKSGSCSKSKRDFSEEILALIAFENSLASKTSKENLQRANSLYSAVNKSLPKDITLDFFN